MLFAYRDINPTQRFPIITVLLICINIGVFLAQIFSDTGYREIINQYAFIPYELHHGNVPGSAAVHPFATLISYMFLHANTAHLVFNMLFLWIFGNNVEDNMQRLGFVFFYLLTGAICALAFERIYPGAKTHLIGASGAVSAVLGAYLFLYPRAKIRVLVLIFPVTVPAFLFLGVWFLIQVTNFFKGTSNVAWIAHIAGFIFGAILYRFFLRKR